MESAWAENDSKTGWSMECYVAASVGEGSSLFFQPRTGASAPAIEVYIAGCCGGVPVILTKTIVCTESGEDDYEPDIKLGTRYYNEDMYYGEDGQLTWFNAGVRVGVGIGLGMCVGVGIGVGLLMRSYQATTSNIRRRFL
ncbi:Uncharacterized protein At1g01500 [Linum perenne]